MKRYKRFKFDELSINHLHRDVDILYNQHKNRFKKLTDLVNFIATQLSTDKNTVLQILQLMEKNK